MASLSGTMTWVDAAKRTDPSGRAARIAEMQSQLNLISVDPIFAETNLPIGHQHTSRTSIPLPTWIGPSQGIRGTKSTTAQDVEPTGIQAAKSDVDMHVAEFGGNLQANLVSESKPHLEGMEQDFARVLVYGNKATSPREFNGFFARANDLGAVNAQNIIDAGGTGSVNASILGVVWGKGKVWVGYPQGSKAGIDMKNRGLVDVTHQAGAGADGETSLAYRTYFFRKAGLIVEDWRCFFRICNIDVTKLRDETGAAVLRKLLTKGFHRIKRYIPGGIPRLYMNSTLEQYLDIQGQDDLKVGGGLTQMTLDGVDVNAWRKIPIRTVDQMTNAEDRVT